MSVEAKTIRLEQADAYLKTFATQVLETREDGRLVLLERSAFYPTSGGQLHDTGQLAGSRVVDVFKEGEGVWHRLDEAVDSSLTNLKGTIDWPRRYRHMQRHSAQHLLSQAFLRVSERFETRSVSLSSAVCTLDLANQPSEANLRQAQTLVNNAAYAALPITAFEVPESEVGHYPLRRPPKVSGQIRLVKMGDWELSACGGTHLRNSSESLPIKVLGAERIRGDLTRVLFVAGWDALADFDVKHRVLTKLSQALSAQVQDLPARLDTLQTSLKEAKTLAQERLEQLAVLRAHYLLNQATITPQAQLVIAHLEDAELAQPLARELTKTPEALVSYHLRKERACKYPADSRLSCSARYERAAANYAALYRR